MRMRHACIPTGLIRLYGQHSGSILCASLSTERLLRIFFEWMGIIVILYICLYIPGYFILPSLESWREFCQERKFQHHWICMISFDANVYQKSHRPQSFSSNSRNRIWCLKWPLPLLLDFKTDGRSKSSIHCECQQRTRTIRWDRATFIWALSLTRVDTNDCRSCDNRSQINLMSYMTGSLSSQNKVGVHRLKSHDCRGFSFDILSVSGAKMKWTSRWIAGWWRRDHNHRDYQANLGYSKMATIFI